MKKINGAANGVMLAAVAASASNKIVNRNGHASTGLSK
jgi:hypothetical protein